MTYTDLEMICLDVMRRKGEEGCTMINEFPIDPKKVRGVLSSLIKKGMVDYDGGDKMLCKPPVFWLTEKGAA